MKKIYLHGYYGKLNVQILTHNVWMKIAAVIITMQNVDSFY